MTKEGRRVQSLTNYFIFTIAGPLKHFMLQRANMSVSLCLSFDAAYYFYNILLVRVSCKGKCLRFFVNICINNTFAYGMFSDINKKCVQYMSSAKAVARSTKVLYTVMSQMYSHVDLFIFTSI